MNRLPFLLLVGLGGFSYTYSPSRSSSLFFCSRLRGLRLALQVLTSNICLFFLSSSISSIRTVVPAVAILDLKAMLSWMKNVFVFLLHCYVYISYTIFVYFFLMRLLGAYCLVHEVIVVYP